MVRNAVGVCDVSTLGKIDIQGPDAAEFLDFVYTNTFSTLKVGPRALWPDAARGRPCAWMTAPRRGWATTIS